MRLVHKGTRSGTILVRALTIPLAFRPSTDSSLGLGHLDGVEHQVDSAGSRDR
jgi:hypothetical protein